MIEFTPLASGSKANAYSLSDGETHLLLEAGLKIKEYRQRASFRIGMFDACLVTHEHGDHAKGVKDLIKAGIDIYTSQGTAEAIGISGHRLHVVQDQGMFQVGSWKVVPFSTIHDAAEPLGFLLASKTGGKCLFALDTHYIHPRFRGLTHLFLECNFDGELLKQNVLEEYVHPFVGKRIWQNHMSLAACKDFLQVQDISKVEEIHLLHLSDQNSDAAGFQSEIERMTGKPVYVARQ